MEPQVGAVRVDRREDFDDRRRRAISLANAADADPHARHEALAVHSDVTLVVRGGVALKDRNEWERARSVEEAIELCQQPVIADDGQPLVGTDRQAGPGEHRRLAHIVLGDGGADGDDAVGVQPVELGGIVRHRMPIVSVTGEFGEGAAVDKHVVAADRFAAAAKAIDADAAGLEVDGVGRLMEPHEKAKRRPRPARNPGRVHGFLSFAGW